MSLPSREISLEMRQAITRWILQSALGLLGYGVVLFAAAGDLGWTWGWVFLGTLALFLAAHPLILVPLDPALLVERSKGLGDEGVKTWDRWITALSAGVFPLLSWVIAGLGLRFGWSPAFPLWGHLAGFVATASGYALFLWAMASNAFFAEGVRIQEERGHRVVRGGPYRFVRHPGYAGALASMLATPFLLGSLWALAPAVAAAAGYILRTHLEDRTLEEELPGYREYAQSTPFRLLPGVW